MANKFSIEAVFSAVDRFSPKVVTMGQKLDAFVGKAGKRFDALGEKTSKAFGDIGKAAGLASIGLGLMGREAFIGGSEFEQAITNVGAVSLLSRDKIADLEAKARQLGATTKFSATQVAQGMELMARAGFTNKEILVGIEGVLAASAAEGAEIADISSVVSNALKGMGLAADQTNRVADVLTLASAKTNSSIMSLGESMKNASPVARQFGQTFEGTVAAVALLQDVGLDASEAGTATATMLTKLAKPTDDVRARMKQLGVSFQDAKGNMLPLEQVFAQMAKAAEKSGGNMKVVSFFADLVGLRGQKAALNLQEAFRSGKFQTLSRELEAAAGSAKKMADLRMDTLKGDLLILESTVEGLKIELFDTQSGPLRGLVQGFTTWLNQNHDEIIHAIGDAVQWVRANAEELVTWGTRLGKFALAFWAIDKAVRTAALGFELFGLGKDMVMGVGKAALWAAGRMGMFNATVATNVQLMGVGQLGALRMGLNYSKLGTAINGINSPLAKIGLVGAAAFAGWELGKWINETFELDKKLQGVFDTLFRGKDTLDAMGNRNQGEAGLDPNAQHMADGTVLRADGSVAVKGKNWQRYELRYNQKRMGVATGMPAFPGSTSPLAVPNVADPVVSPLIPQVPSPQTTIAREISETVNRSEVDIKVSAADGTKAEVQQKKRGRSPVAVSSSGAL